MSESLSIQSAECSESSDDIEIFFERLLVVADYGRGKVYKIVDLRTDEIIYVGCTIQEIKYRFSQHRSWLRKHPDSKYARFVELHGGIEHFEIRLIENFPCQYREELLERERFFIQMLKPPCNTVMMRNITPKIKPAKTRITHVCIKCKQDCHTAQGLQRHLAKKYPCDRDVNYPCRFCSKFYNHRSSRDKHQQTCSAAFTSAVAYKVSNSNIEKITAEAQNNRLESKQQNIQDLEEEALTIEEQLLLIKQKKIQARLSRLQCSQ